VSATVVVRVNLTDLQSGLGSGTIDGINQPVSAGAVRRMAADAHLIPCVLGGGSEILDWGRAKRLFTFPQKLAAAERDGGCAGCGAPPGMTVVHHVRWWARDAGPTDLSNALLLCTSCHHRVHDDGWDIRIDGTGVNARVWFLPPAWLDPARSPRLGGKARYDLIAA
jgi:5-methylcytosine-specific restriction protein A